MRKAKGILGVVVGLMLLFHAGGTVAVASDPGGNNGTIKMHEGNTENEPIRANDPHVCTFHIHGFNFDSNSSGQWWIDQHAPTGSAAASNGTWAADGSGNWRTAVMSLPPGHYKAYAKQMAPATPGGEKQKVFWVECGQSTSGGNTTGTTSGNTNGTNGSNGGGSNGGTNGGNEQSAPTRGTQNTGSKSKSKSGTGSKSKGAGSVTGTGSQTGGSNTAGSVNGGTDNTGSVSDHGGTTSGGTNGTTSGATNGTTGTTGTTSGGTNGTNDNGGNGGTNGTNVTNVSGQGSVNTSASSVTGTGNLPSTSQNQNVPSTAIQNLPSTSTAVSDSTPLAIFGGFLLAFGAFMLRRPRSQQR